MCAVARSAKDHEAARTGMKNMAGLEVESTYSVKEAPALIYSPLAYASNVPFFISPREPPSEKSYTGE